MPSTLIRLVLADVDGTLVTSGKVLTAGTIDAVHRLREAGILFAVTSGRPPRGMEMLVEPLDIQLPIASPQHRNGQRGPSGEAGSTKDHR